MYNWSTNDLAARQRLMLKLACANCNEVDEVLRITIDAQPCRATTTTTTTTTIIIERFIVIVNDLLMINNTMEQQATSALHNKTQRPGSGTQTYCVTQSS